MLSVLDAVQAAVSNLTVLFPKAEKIRMEEVEISEDDQFWLITLSFIDPGRESPLIHALQGGEAREYRVVKVNKATGEVRSIKMRERTNV